MLFLDDSAVKPVFGYPLEQHLRVTGRTIAFPIELCVCTLHELALNEEGLFRIAGGMYWIKIIISTHEQVALCSSS